MCFSKISDLDTYKTIVSGKIECVDCGKVSDRYFMNVGACGILTDVAHNTPVGLKTAFGRAAYVMKALTELTPENLRPIKMKIESEEVSGEYVSYMALVANSKSVGGFQKMAPLASVHDGLLDVLVDNDENHDEHKQPYLLSDDLCGEDVATQNLAQCEAGRTRHFLLDGLLGNHFLERSLRSRFGSFRLRLLLF